MTRPSSSSSLGGQRLPVNPRRHKVAPEQRKRVATACNNCNVRRIKCSGDRPCRQCAASSRECVYPVIIEKVSVPRQELDKLRARLATVERGLAEAVPNATHRQQLLARVAGSNTTALFGEATTEPDTGIVFARGGSGADSPGSLRGGEIASLPVEPEDEHTAEGRLLQDGDGVTRYLGGTSGATFLDHLKEFMATIFPLAFHTTMPGAPPEDGRTFLSSVGRYQTYDSRPLVIPSVDPLWLPSWEEMKMRLTEVRYFIGEGHGPSGGISYYGRWDEIPQDPRAVAASTGLHADMESNRHLAFYHAAFAFSCVFSATTANSKVQDGQGQLGETFFARARLLLGNPLDIKGYSSNDVAVLGLMGIYMAEMNRRDVAYMYVSTAMHIAIMHGVHRGWGVDEHLKRVFWTLYCLDRWLSCLMGRPPTIQDEAIKLGVPREAIGMPSPAGLRAHVELGRVAGYIVCNTYRVAPSAAHISDRSVSHVDRALRMLASWVHNLPEPLRISYETFSNDRSLCILHMEYNQFVIVTIRPIFFLAVKKAVADRFVSRNWNIEDHAQIAHIRECSDAARRNLRLGRWVQNLSPRQKLLLPDMHNVFNAAIILLLHQIVFVNLRTNDVSDIAFAQEVFEREAGFGDTYGADCAKVLSDLSALVRKLRELMFEGLPETTIPTSATAASDRPVGAGAGGGIPGEGIVSSLSAHGGLGLLPAHHHNPQGTSISDLAITTAATAAGGQHMFMPPQMPEGNAIYQELITWLDSNDYQAYGNFVV